MELPPLTLGIEEEYQLIDPESRELAPWGPELIEEGEKVLPGQLKPEMKRSQIEVATRVCGSIAEARAEVLRLRRGVCRLARGHGLEIAAASTHPFSKWTEQPATAAKRYLQLEDDLADVVRRLLIFGTHVHVGIEDPELRIDVMNQARYFMPHILALSASSPFWRGRDTGLKSYRSVIFEDMPRSGLPPTFGSWDEYQGFVDTLVETRSIDDPTKIWWDIRPHPSFPTLEFRIADVCTRTDEVMAIAALLQAIVAKLIQLRTQNRSWRDYRHHLIVENKWRAVRYGVEGKLIDFGRKREVPVRFLVGELLELVDDVVDPLGSRREIDGVRTILERGSSADRQLETWRQTDDLKAVVDRLVKETAEGLDEEDG